MNAHFGLKQQTKLVNYITQVAPTLKNCATCLTVVCCGVFVYVGTCEWHSSPCLCARLAVCRLMGDVCSASEFAAFCPLICAVTMETGALAGTTEMAMLWLGGLMRERGLAGVPTGQLLTASFCHTQKGGRRVRKVGKEGKK